MDYDNDGDNDLFITATNGLARLLNNDGLFNFTDVSIAAGLSGFNTNNFGVSFGDYDRDGHLDFYLARYSMTGNVNDPNQTNALYKNNGDGTFTNVTAAAGVGNGIQPSFMGVWIDVDHNSWPDLYVINDRVLWGNALYLNNGDGTFTRRLRLGCIMKLLDRINREGTTVLMATHDSGIVDQMRKRVIELDGGHVIRDQVRGVYGYTG